MNLIDLLVFAVAEIIMYAIHAAIVTAVGLIVLAIITVTIIWFKD